MTQAYLGISWSKRSLFEEEVKSIQKVLAQYGIELFVFVDQYRFGTGEEKIMMQKAFEHIDQSDMMIVEMSKKAVGVGIELGYAFAQQKPILYLRKKEAPYSTTTAGCASASMAYGNTQELERELTIAIESLIQN